MRVIEAFQQDAATDHPARSEEDVHSRRASSQPPRVASNSKPSDSPRESIRTSFVRRATVIDTRLWTSWFGSVLRSSARNDPLDHLTLRCRVRIRVAPWSSRQVALRTGVEIPIFRIAPKPVAE